MVCVLLRVCVCVCVFVSAPNIEGSVINGLIAEDNDKHPSLSCHLSLLVCAYACVCVCVCVLCEKAIFSRVMANVKPIAC